MKIDLTPPQSATILNALHNRCDLMRDMAAIYAREGKDEAVQYCLNERKALKELIEKFRTL